MGESSIQWSRTGNPIDGIVMLIFMQYMYRRLNRDADISCNTCVVVASYILLQISLHCCVNVAAVFCDLVKPSFVEYIPVRSSCRAARPWCRSLPARMAPVTSSLAVISSALRLCTTKTIAVAKHPQVQRLQISNRLYLRSVFWSQA